MLIRPQRVTTRCVSTSSSARRSSTRIPKIAPDAPVIATTTGAKDAILAGSRPSKLAGGMILVIGATGWTGSEATRHLVLRGKQVRALTRDRAKAEAMPALRGAEIAVGDSTKPE